MSQSKTKETATIADRFLKDTHDSHKPVSLYLVNGFQLKGEIQEFDEETILFKHKGVHQLIMRSAVAGMYLLPDPKGGTVEWWREYTSNPSGK